MKTLLSVALAFMLVVGIANASDTDSWFDMQNCEICVSMTENPELMMNMSWDHHDISNGMVSITNVKPEFLDAYKKAHAKMETVIERIQAGEQVNMCNMCKGISEYAMAGAKMETVESNNVIVGLTTSDDPAIVSKIHAWADRTRTEMKKMAEMDHSSHDGHNH
jgi:hypothetical protein